MSKKKEDVKAGKEEALIGLMGYIKKQVKEVGTVNTAHGPLYVLDPEVVDKYVKEIEAVEEPEPVPVKAEVHAKSEASVPPPKQEHHW